MWTADDKFFGASLATKLGVASPKTLVLPNKEYVPGIEPRREPAQPRVSRSTGTAIVEYVGLPCILKDAHGGGWKDVYVCRSLDELIHHYDTSGPADDDRAGVHRVGAVRPLPLHRPGGDPADEVRPAGAASTSSSTTISRPSSAAAIVQDARTLVRALGYDMNSIEFAVRDGIPYAIDFMNPAPDMDINSLTPHYFEWVVKHDGRPGDQAGAEPRPQAKEMQWHALFGGDVPAPGRRDAPPARLTAGCVIATSAMRRRLPRRC